MKFNFTFILFILSTLFSNAEAQSTSCSDIFLTAETIAVHDYPPGDPLESLNGFTTKRIYVGTGDTDDFLNAIASVFDLGAVWEFNPTGVVYQHASGSHLAHHIDPTLFTINPMIEYDSWFTIGATPGDSVGIGQVDAITGAWQAPFDLGNGFSVNDPGGSSIYSTLPSSNTFAVSGDDQKILVAQITTDDVFTLGFMVQVWPNSIGGSNLLTCPLTYSNTLPIELFSFEAKAVENTSLLEWMTTSEINNSHFDIEWSTNGIDFERLTQIEGAGTTRESQEYEYYHKTPVQGKNYYRLKQLDYSGEFEYSEIRMVKHEKEDNSLTAYPILVEEYINIEWKNDLEQPAAVLVSDVLGQLVYQANIDAGISQTILHLNNLDSGFYFLWLDDIDHAAVKFFKK